MPTRNKYIDSIKGIAIILVILPHCIQYGSGQSFQNDCLFYDNSIFKFIYTFHMPVFMLISGYLYRFTVQKYSYESIIKSRITSLLIPILIWHSLYILVKYIEVGDEYFANFYFSSYVRYLWFLWAVFWNSLIVAFVNKLTNDSPAIYLLLFILFLFLPNIYNINYYVYMYPYYICGYYLNDCQSQTLTYIKNKLTSSTCIIILSFLFILLLHYYSREYYVYESGTSIIHNKSISIPMILINIYRWTIGFIGSFLFFTLSAFLYDKSKELIIKMYLSEIGKRTLGIYIISDYSFRFFYYLPIYELNYFFIIIEAILILCASFIVTLELESNYFTRKLLLGGR